MQLTEEEFKAFEDNKELIVQETSSGLVSFGFIVLNEDLVPRKGAPGIVFGGDFPIEQVKKYLAYIQLKINETERLTKDRQNANK